ncbi:MAG TPA: mechanosensitive ion channel family protein [Bryobacteraceae bacterium]|nr:mechanosensitive ion channel family protein [Bryobacteraceae bacterium]
MRPKPIWDRLNVELLVTQFVAWLPSLLASVLILFFFWLWFRLTHKTLRRLLHRAGLEEAFIGMLVGVYRFTILAIGIIMAASQLGINIGAALAGLGVLGLTIGFAAKDSLSNIMAGFLIFWDKPFHVDEWVTLADHYGRVAEITMRTTRVQTRDNKWVIIPNATVIDQIMINHSAHGKTRLQIPIGIGYGEDVASARAVILDVCAHADYILKDPGPAVVLNDLAASTVDLLVFAWIADAANEKPHFFALLEAIKAALDKAGIEIPWPQLDLRVRSISHEVLAQMGVPERRSEITAR